MNEKEVIKKIHLLKDIRPTQQDMQTVRKKITGVAKIDTHKFYYFWGKSKLQKTYSFLSILTLLLLVILFGTRQTQLFQTTIYQTQIAIAQNNYQKAKLSLEFSQKKLNLLQKNHDPKNMNNLLDSLHTTNAYVSQLRLEGENGQYSKDQCKAIYQSFAISIDSTEKTLKQIEQNTTDPSVKTAVEQSTPQVTQIEKQVDSRLGFYRK